MAELKYRGTWAQCADYQTDDAVSNVGSVWKAVQQSAGKEPAFNNPEFWVEVTPEEKEQIRDEIADDNPVLLDLKHDETKDILNTDPRAGAENWHVERDIADALVNTRFAPNINNPFVTEQDIPVLTTNLSEFVTLPKPDEVGLIYDGHFDEESKILGVCGDNFVAWYDDKATQWTVQKIQGAWRGICKHGNSWVVAGTNAVCAGAINALVNGSVRAGKYNDCASSGGRVFMVADGVVAWSDTGTGSWQGIETEAGYGEGVCYHERENKFYMVGRAGCRTTVDGMSFDVVDNFPSGTWRDIKRGEDGLYACSGKIAYRKDSIGDEATPDWEVTDAGSGGWNNIAQGEGYVVAAANGKATQSKSRNILFDDTDVPDYIYTSVCFGYSRFWLLGSNVAVALILDIAGAINNAEKPNANNPFTTKIYVDGRLEAFRVETNKVVGEKIAEAKDELADFTAEQIEVAKGELEQGMAQYAVPDATEAVAGKARFTTDDEFADGSHDDLMPKASQVAAKTGEIEKRLEDAFKSINANSLKPSYVYESTGLTVAVVNTDNSFEVNKDTRSKIKTGDEIIISDYKYSIQQTSYDPHSDVTKYVVNDFVTNAILRNIIAKKVRYITHPDQAPAISKVEVPPSGYNSQNMPNVSDNFRYMTPESTYALFQYLIHEMGDVIGGFEYEDTSETISSLDPSNKNEIVVLVTTSALYDKVVVGDFVKIVKENLANIIARVNAIEQVDSTHVKLTLDKDVPDAYSGAKIWRQTDAIFVDGDATLNDIQAGPNPSVSKIVINGDPDELFNKLKVGDKIKIKSASDDDFTIITITQIDKTSDGVIILTDKKVANKYENGEVSFEGATVKPTPGKLVESINVTVEPEFVENGQTAQAKAEVLPPDAANRNVKWSLSGDGTIATINSDTGLITANGNGRFGSLRVIATAQDETAKTGMASFSVGNKYNATVKQGGNMIYLKCKLDDITNNFIAGDYVKLTSTTGEEKTALVTDIQRTEPNEYYAEDYDIFIMALDQEVTADFNNCAIAKTDDPAIPGDNVNPTGCTLYLTPSVAFNTDKVIAKVRFTPDNTSNKNITWTVNKGTMGSANITPNSSSTSDRAEITFTVNGTNYFGNLTATVQSVAYSSARQTKAITIIDECYVFGAENYGADGASEYAKTGEWTVKVPKGITQAYIVAIGNGGDGGNSPNVINGNTHRVSNGSKGTGTQGGLAGGPDAISSNIGKLVNAQYGIYFTGGGGGSGGGGSGEMKGSPNNVININSDKLFVKILTDKTEIIDTENIKIITALAGAGNSGGNGGNGGPNQSGSNGKGSYGGIGGIGRGNISYYSAGGGGGGGGGGYYSVFEGIRNSITIKAGDGENGGQKPKSGTDTTSTPENVHDGASGNGGVGGKGYGAGGGGAGTGRGGERPSTISFGGRGARGLVWIKFVRN